MRNGFPLAQIGTEPKRSYAASMHVARSLAMLVVALGSALGVVSTASAATCAGSGIATTDGDIVVRFSTTTDAIVQTLDLSGLAPQLTATVVSPDGSTAYVADRGFNDGAVYVIDTATMTRTATLVAGSGVPGATMATALVLSADGTRLYVAYTDNVGPRIRVIDTSTRTTTTTYATPGGQDATGLALSADGTTLYAAASRLYAMSAADGTNAQALSDPGTALRVVLSPDRSTRYVLGDTTQNVLVQRGTAQATQLAGALGGRGLSLAIAPDGGTLYAGVEGTGARSLFAVDTASGAATPIGSSATGFGSMSVAVKPDGRAIYDGTERALDILTPGSPTVRTIAGTTGSITSLAVCPAQAPSAPTGAKGDAGDTVVSVSWSAPAGDGGAAITGYTATASPGGATCTTTGATTCLFTGLRNGTAYTFTVTATNVAGTSAASEASKRVTPRKDNRARVLTVGPAAVSYTKKGVGVAFNVTATGAGVIAAAMTYKGDRYCSVSKRVSAAGVYRVRCVMKAAGRALARKRSTTYALNVSFSPTNGPLASAKPSVVVKRRR